MTLDDFMELVGRFCDLAENSVERSRRGLDVGGYLDRLDGAFSIVSSALGQVAWSELPRMRLPTVGERMVYALDDEGNPNPDVSLSKCLDFDGKTIPIYDSDSGQCYLLKKGDRFVGLGTYNMFPESDIILMSLTDRLDAYLNEISENVSKGRSPEKLANIGKGRKQK